MPKLQRLDGSAENGWLPPPTTVRQWPQVYNRRVRPNWPFLISCEPGAVYLNKAKPTRRNDDFDQLGDALL